MKNRFEHYLRTLAGRCAPTTLRRVRTTLGGFMQWLQSHGVDQWHEVTTEQICAWIAWKDRTVKPRTLHSYKQEVKWFLSWMHRKECLLVNPWNETLDGKPPPYNPRYVPTLGQARNVLESVTEHNMHAARDQAILELAYGCGLRRKEIQQLNVSDIREDWLRVRGKGDVERVVPLGMQAKKALLFYVAGERLKAMGFSKKHEPGLFLTRYGTRLGVDAYCYILSRSRLNRTCTLHGLRHACATHMLKNGANIVLLQKLLGHRKLSSTQIYTEVDRSDMADLLRRFHPRG